jgi:hypothetical protein
MHTSSQTKTPASSVIANLHTPKAQLSIGTSEAGEGVFLAEGVRPSLMNTIICQWVREIPTFLSPNHATEAGQLSKADARRSSWTVPEQAHFDLAAPL